MFGTLMATPVVHEVVSEIGVKTSETEPKKEIRKTVRISIPVKYRMKKKAIGTRPQEMMKPKEKMKRPNLKFFLWMGAASFVGIIAAELFMSAIRGATIRRGIV